METKSQLFPEVEEFTQKELLKSAVSMWQENEVYLSSLEASVRFNIRPKYTKMIINYGVVRVRFSSSPQFSLGEIVSKTDRSKLIKSFDRDYDLWTFAPILQIDNGVSVLAKFLSCFGGTEYYFDQFTYPYPFSLVPFILEKFGRETFERLEDSLISGRKDYFYVPVVEEFLKCLPKKLMTTTKKLAIPKEKKTSSK